MSRQTIRALNAALERWLDHVFFAFLEVSVLTLPVLLILTGVPDQDTVSLSALSALASAVFGVASFRGRYIDVGRWPRPGDLVTIPVRSAYYGFALGFGTWAGVEGQVPNAPWWTGVLVPLILVGVLLSLFPWVVRRVQKIAASNR